MTRIRLTIFTVRRIKCRGKVNAFRQGKATRHAFFVIMVIAEITLQHRLICQLKVQPQASVLSTDMAIGGVAMALIVQQVEAIFHPVSRIDWAAEIHRCQRSRPCTLPYCDAMQRCIDRSFRHQIKHPCWISRAIQRSSDAAQHLNVLELFGRIFRRGDGVQAINHMVLYHAPLHAAGLWADAVTLNGR